MLQHPPPPNRYHRPPEGSDGPGDPLSLLRHDLRSLLTPITGRAQLIRRTAVREDAPDRDRLLAHTAEIERAVWALARRIDRIGPEELGRGTGPDA